MFRSTPLNLCLGLGLSLAATHTQAATLNGSYVAGNGSTVYNLTETGELDWAYWQTTSNPFNGNKTNEKSTGSLISNLSPIGGGSLQGSTNSNRPQTDFSFSDGISPVSGTITNFQGAFNTGLGIHGAGTSTSILLPDAGMTYEISIFVSGYAVGTNLGFPTGQERLAEMTVSLAGASDYVDYSFESDIVSPKEDGIYTITASADSNDASLLIDFRLFMQDGLDDSGSNAHTYITAVAISAVPEPSTYAALIGASMLGWAFMRRRRR